MSLRDGLRTVLTEGLPTYKVFDYDAPLDAIGKPTVCFWVSSLKPLASAPNGNYEVTYTVAVYTGHQDPVKAEAALDDHMEEVLAVLWDAPGFILSGAERASAKENTVHAWLLTLTGGITITHSED